MSKIRQQTAKEIIEYIDASLDSDQEFQARLFDKKFIGPDDAYFSGRKFVYLKIKKFLVEKFDLKTKNKGK